MERKLADADMSEEEQNNILKYLERKETEYMRLQRHKMGVDDFELLTMIGKGAFGEVYFSAKPLIFLFCSMIREGEDDLRLNLMESFSPLYHVVSAILN